MIDFPDLSSTSVIGYDTETNGLDPHKSIPVGYVLTWGFRPEESRYYPIRHKGGGNLEATPVIAFFQRLLSRTDLRVVMHNAAFDLWMSNKDGIVIKGEIEDTGNNDPLIDENHGKYNLEICAERADMDIVRRRRVIEARLDDLKAEVKAEYPHYTPSTVAMMKAALEADLESLDRISPKKATAMYEYLAGRFGGKATRDQMENFHLLPGDDPMANEYAAGDGTTTLQLWRWQQGMLDRYNLRKVWAVEQKLVPILHRARLRGIKVDEDELDRVEADIKTMHAEASAKIGDINPKAPSELKPYLQDIATGFGAHDWDETIVPRPPRTAPSKTFPDGQDSFTEAYLETFEAGEEIIRVKKLMTLQSTFITPLRERHIHNGHVYPNFWQMASDDYGTVTGRFSCSDPNMQQIPKRNEELGRIFRRVFVPDSPDHHLWEFDYSQCEYRLFAHFANATGLINSYNEEGIDMHDYVSQLLGMPRKDAKNMNFGILYRMGDRSLAKKMRISIAEAAAYRAEYFAKIPEARTFAEQASAIARHRGFIKTLLGRRRRYRNPSAQDYQAINSICQGGNADIMKQAMILIDDYFETTGRGHFGFSVHDAAVSFFPADDVKTATEVYRLMTDINEETYGYSLRVKMEVDGGHGKNWSEASYPEPENKWKLAA